MSDDLESAPGGFQQPRAILASDLRAPMGEKLGVSLVEVEHGRVAFAETTLHHGQGRLCATATSTLLVFGVEPRPDGALQY